MSAFGGSSKARAKASIKWEVVRRDGTRELLSYAEGEGAEAQEVWEQIKHNFTETEDSDKEEING